MTIFQIGLNDNTYSWTQKELEEGLKKLAEWQSKKWLGLQLVEKLLDKDIEWKKIAEATESILEELTVQVLKTDNKQLITLFFRAVRNFNKIQDEYGYRVNSIEFYDKHLQEPAFRIQETNLRLDVQEDKVVVKTHHKVKRKGNQRPLILNAEGHKVTKICINGVKLERHEYLCTSCEIIIIDPPGKENFEIDLYTEINPYGNTSGKGLYQRGGYLVTRCQLKDTHRIFPCIDSRPDRPSKCTTTIIADPRKYPICLSNGNLVNEYTTKDGRKTIIWHDPFPKPSHRFACVMGDLAVRKDLYTTCSGRVVKLNVYMEKGKEKLAEYALETLKKAMKCDEKCFKQEYNLNELNMVALPGFKAGPTAGKGLIIFDESDLLVDPSCSIDGDYPHVAKQILDAYCRNSWSGKPASDSFELVLEEAYSKFRSTLIMEYLFGPEQVRPFSVMMLRDQQFHDKATPQKKGIKSFYSLGGIDDSRTCLKVPEIFRMLLTILNADPNIDGFRVFREAQKESTTFRQLLTKLQELSGVEQTQFERWFHQAGTPEVEVCMEYDTQKKQVQLSFRQTCRDPKTKKLQKPFLIPVNVELLTTKGEVIVPTRLVCLKDNELKLRFEGVGEKPVPVFQHDFSAPIKLHYDYSDEELMCILRNEQDSFAQYEAGRVYIQRVLHKLYKGFCDGGEPKVPRNVVKTLKTELHTELLQKNPNPLVICSLLSMPRNGSIMKYIIEGNEKLTSAWKRYSAMHARMLFRKTLARELEPELLLVLERYPAQKSTYRSKSNWGTHQFIEHSKRFLRNVCLSYLSDLQNDEYLQRTASLISSGNFNDRYMARCILAGYKSPKAKELLKSNANMKWSDVSIDLRKRRNLQTLTFAEECLWEMSQGLTQQRLTKRWPRRLQPKNGSSN